MNGIHDLGGMDGFALPVREADEPAFHAEWERIVFGSHLAMKKPWSIDTSRHGVERIPPAEYLATPYYARWLIRNEMLLIEYGLVTAAELADPDAVVAAQPVEGSGEASPSDLLAGSLSAPDGEPKPARFNIGDRVRVRNEHPEGHTRAPRYARGRVGIVQRDQGVHVFPDTNAHDLGTHPQHCYSIMFEATELWGSRGVPGDRVYIDLFDDYLEPAD